MNEKQKVRKRKLKRLIGVFVVVAVVLWLIGGFGVYGLFRLYNATEEASRFGDSFGAISALFSAFALGGVAIAIYLQMNELQLQRTELKMTRRELKKSAEAQTELVKLQSLTTLLSSYLAQYSASKSEVDNEYCAMIAVRGNLVENNLWYRILVCRAEIEAITNKKADKNLVGVTSVNIPTLRREVAMRHLLRAISEVDSRLRIVNSSPTVDGHTIEQIKDLRWRIGNTEGWLRQAGDTELAALIYTALLKFEKVMPNLDRPNSLRSLAIELMDEVNRMYNAAAQLPPPTYTGPNKP